jgi:hypothetical protein
MSEHPLFTKPPHVRLHLAMFSMSLRLEMGHRHPTRLRTDYTGASFKCLYHECSGLSPRLDVQLLGDEFHTTYEIPVL